MCSCYRGKRCRIENVLENSLGNSPCTNTIGKCSNMEKIRFIGKENSTWTMILGSFSRISGYGDEESRKYRRYVEITGFEGASGI